MDQILLAPLTAFETSLDALIHSLTTTNTFAGGPKAAEDLVSADHNLDKALHLLKQHQDNYAEIKRLRTQRYQLQQTLKETLLEAWNLRKQLGEIHPSILQDSDEEAESQQPSKPVDYQTLLSFASRIGKHNAIAAQEAERISERQHIEAQKKRQVEKPNTNGNVGEGSFASIRPATGHSNVTQEAQNSFLDLKNVIMFQRALKTAPFPNAEDLRKGALGRLQELKEQYGEETMEAEAEKMVRESELKQPEKKVELPTESETVMDSKPTKSETTEHRPAQVAPLQQIPLPPRPPVKKIDLDFPGSDDEDD